jgi:1-acyl-sn-glycerol-3-phosphate acyltransferase
MIRRCYRIGGIILGIVVLVPLHYLWRLFGARSPWPRRFLFWAGYMAGLRIRTVGAFRRKNVLFVANHGSWLDILAIGGHTGAAFVAKAELQEFGLVRWLSDMNDTIYIARQDRSSLHDKADELRTALASGRAAALFPEATTKGGKDVLPFRASLLASVFPPIEGLHVQPIALDFGDIAEEIAWGDEHGKDNALRIFSRPGTIKLTMRFLEPMTPGGELDRKKLARDSRDAIVASLHAGEAASAPL